MKVFGSSKIQFITRFYLYDKKKNDFIVEIALGRCKNQFFFKAKLF